jgi:hypothetical protein
MQPALCPYTMAGTAILGAAARAHIPASPAIGDAGHVNQCLTSGIREASDARPPRALRGESLVVDVVAGYGARLVCAHHGNPAKAVEGRRFWR